MRAPSPGPRAAEVAAALDRPLEVANLRMAEARLTGDPGFYSLASLALDCSGDTSTSTRQARAHIALQFHQFAEAERIAAELTRNEGQWPDWMLLGDAQMEQGRLDEATVSYETAMRQRPGLLLYDRIGWMRWLRGNLPGAIEVQKLAVSAGSPADPEPFAWVLTRLGWLHALAGEPTPELDAALSLLPDYPQARFARGRVRLHAGDAAAAEDLAVVAHTVEGARALSELPRASGEAAVDVAATGVQDRRGFSVWLADREPVRALELAKAELADRQDAVTQMAAAWAGHKAGKDTSALARAALATGCIEPRVLLHGGIILGDSALLTRALAMGPGLLPSERRLAEESLRLDRPTPDAVRENR